MQDRDGAAEPTGLGPLRLEGLSLWIEGDGPPPFMAVPMPVDGVEFWERGSHGSAPDPLAVAAFIGYLAGRVAAVPEGRDVVRIDVAAHPGGVSAWYRIVSRVAAGPGPSAN